MIICAALKIQIEGLDHTTILPCVRHCDGFEILEDLGYAPKTKYKVLEQGFITHDRQFLNRGEAWKYATTNGQVPAVIRNRYSYVGKPELFSEDIY